MAAHLKWKIDAWLYSILSDREYTIIKFRYIMDVTFANIANRLNVSTEKVRQLELTAVKKLKHPKSARFRRRIIVKNILLNDSFFNITNILSNCDFYNSHDNYHHIDNTGYSVAVC